MAFFFKGFGSTLKRDVCTEQILRKFLGSIKILGNRCDCLSFLEALVSCFSISVSCFSIPFSCFSSLFLKSLVSRVSCPSFFYSLVSHVPYFSILLCFVFRVSFLNLLFQSFRCPCPLFLESRVSCFLILLSLVSLVSRFSCVLFSESLSQILYFKVFDFQVPCFSIPFSCFSSLFLMSRVSCPSFCDSLVSGVP